MFLVLAKVSSLLVPHQLNLVDFGYELQEEIFQGAKWRKFRKDQEATPFGQNNRRYCDGL